MTLYSVKTCCIMTREVIEIRNFGPISNVVLSISPLTIFIGDQGSGKSTISKLLTICRDIRWRHDILEGDKASILRPFKEFSIDEFFRKDTFFSYKEDSDSDNSDSIVYENGTFIFKMSGVDDVDEAKKRLKILIIETAQSLAKRTGNDKIEDTDSYTRKLLRANTRIGLYLPAERNIVGILSQSLASIILHKIPFPDVILEFMSIFEKAKKEFSSFDVPFLNARFIEREGNNRIILPDSNKEISFNACSSGLQSTLPMMMVIDYSRKTNCFDSFVVEEPEQNLFPKNQRELMFYFASKLNNNKCNFVLTTHSPYLLSCLNVQLLASKLYATDGLKDEVSNIIKKDFVVDSKDVAVYSLGIKAEDNEYCRSLISQTTGLVSINELDAVSEYIGDDYERLYSLYLRTRKK